MSLSYQDDDFALKSPRIIMKDGFKELISFNV